MANALYDTGRQGFLDGSIDWDTDTIQAYLVTSAYTFSGAHSTTAQVTSPVATSPAFTGKTVTDGVADAADITFSAVAAGSTVNGIVIYSATADRLIAYIDTATGLPITTNNGDITIQWDSGANRIFKL